jgi:signal transduction histidine kinase
VADLRPALIVIATATLALLATVVTGATELVDFAYRSASLHIALETAAALISGVAAYLVYGRYRESSLPGDLMLVVSLAIFASANLFFSALPGIAGGDMVFETWSSLAARTLGAALFAASVFAPEITLSHPRRVALQTLGGAAAVLAGIGIAVLLLEPVLPIGVDPSVSPDTPGRAFLEGNVVLHVIQLAAASLFAIAAVGFARRAARTRDELMTWFAAGAVLSAFARVHYFLFPSLYTEWVYTGDFFRVAFYVVLLIGIGREIDRYWRDRARAAVLEERRRMARDLHDGLAQELAFISMQSKYLAGPDDDQSMAQIAVAADRALDESRRAIAALTRPLDEPLAVVLADVAEEVAGRVGLELDLNLSEEVDVSPQTREALLRIVREAVTNAARHGKATLVRIELSNGRGLRLRISDNGTGFDPTRTEPSEIGGFGLTSMRERAEELGGYLNVRSSPGFGTEIEVALP